MYNIQNIKHNYSLFVCRLDQVSSGEGALLAISYAMYFIKER